jgi:hypothetical protein
MEEVTLSDKLSFFCITSANVKMASIGKTLLLVWHFFLKWGSPSSASKRRIQLLFKLIQRGSIKIRYHKTRSHHLIPRNPIMGEITYCQRLYPKNRNKRPTNWIPGASLSHPIAKVEAHNQFSRPLATTLSLTSEAITIIEPMVHLQSRDPRSPFQFYWQGCWKTSRA